jgi:hypothetical protein
MGLEAGGWVPLRVSLKRLDWPSTTDQTRTCSSFSAPPCPAFSAGRHRLIVPSNQLQPSPSDRPFLPPHFFVFSRSAVN